MTNSINLHERRKIRLRAKLRRINAERPRLTVQRTNTHIYAQIIGEQATILASASTVEKETRNNLKNGGNIEAAKKIGALIAERALKAGVNTVVFDRSGYIYHGRVKALADAARESGLSF
jgi:large subunit ribosomal protein L18